MTGFFNSIFSSHRTTLTCLAIMIFCAFIVPGALPAQNLTEKDDFSYILQLYLAGDAYLSDLSSEISAFQGKYPQSQYHDYLVYLDANAALKLGDINRARQLYGNLLDKPLHPYVLADTYLNYAISYYNTSEYPAALALLNELEKKTANPFYLYQVNVWRGRIFASQGYYLSAEQDYRKALAYDPKEIHFDHFQVLLKLNRHDEALASLNSVPADSSDLLRYHSSWLNYLLARGDYSDFDTYLDQQQDVTLATNPQILPLRIRKELETEDYSTAGKLLEIAEGQSPQIVFYNAILLARSGSEVVADSLFRVLTLSGPGDIPVYAYLERLKLLYAKDPVITSWQLENYLSAEKVELSEPYYLLGTFYSNQGKHLEAIGKYLAALDYPISPMLEDRVDEKVAESYYLAGETSLAQDAYNRYLNKQTEGRYRDKAFFYLGLLHFIQRDYVKAKLNLQKILDEYPKSAWLDEARFYLAEINFFAGNYTLAAEIYQSIVLTDANYPHVILRLAQTDFYQQRYPEAIRLLQSLPSSDLDFDAKVLFAGIRFSQQDYEQALALYEEAAALANTDDEKTEAKSYRAYTLYYLKRYTEASSVFYDLSRDNTNADIYLYQAAKSAAQGGEWMRALELYDQFLSEFTDSSYFLPVLAEIATTQFNLGQFEPAFQDWLNLLRRFTANTSVAEDDLVLLNEVFIGLEQCARRIEDPRLIVQLSEMVDLFRSDYIRFELEYLIVKLYSGFELWDSLLAEAEQLRSDLNLPQTKRNAIEMLMVQSLIKLNRLEAADSLASEIYVNTQSRESLIKLAEVTALSGNAELALERYYQAWQLAADAELWLRMSELSAQNRFIRFPEIWSSGEKYLKIHPQARVYRLQYLWATGDTLAVLAQADSILAVEAIPWLRANAEYYRGLIASRQKDNTSALRSFRKVRLLYSDLRDIYIQASYEYIVVLLRLQARQEALLALDEVRDDLSEEQLSQIDSLLGSAEGEDQ